MIYKYPLLGTYPKEMTYQYVIGMSKGCWHPMFIAALFIRAKIQNQPTCPSANEDTKKTWSVYTVKYYSVMRMKSCYLPQYGW